MAILRAKIYLLIGLIGYFLFIISQNCWALDQKNKLSVNSSFNFSLADIKQEKYFNQHAKQYNADLDGGVVVKYSKINRDNLEYGAITSLQINSAQRPVSDSLAINHAFIFGKDLEFGEIQIGNNKDVNQKIKVGPAKFAKGSGGINGRYLQYINSAIFTNSDESFILIPQLPIAHGGYASGNFLGQNNHKNIVNYQDQTFGDAKNATKINYFSPKISNWQFGVSFAPNANNILAHPQANKNPDIDLSKIKNIIDIGLNYSNNFDNLGYAFSAIIENAKFDNSKRNNLSAYEIGAVANYFGVTIGGSYGSWNKSLQLKNDQNKADYYTAGIAYEFGHFGTSFTYLNSNFQNNKFEAKSIGFDYKIRKAFTTYIEITKFNFKSKNAKYYNIDHPQSSNLQLKNNQGYVLLTGLLFTF
jgi:hypothetical protein